MNSTPIVILALAACVASASGSILSVAGNDTLVGYRPANLIVNGSFEADGGVATNGSYWATGTGFTPNHVPDRLNRFRPGRQLCDLGQ